MFYVHIPIYPHIILLGLTKAFDVTLKFSF